MQHEQLIKEQITNGMALNDGTTLIVQDAEQLAFALQYRAKHPRWDDYDFKIQCDYNATIPHLLKMNPKPKPKLNLVVTMRSSDIHVCDKENPGRWACGHDWDDAIGNWVRTHQKELGIEFTWPEQHEVDSYRKRNPQTI